MVRKYPSKLDQYSVQINREDIYLNKICRFG